MADPKPTTVESHCPPLRFSIRKMLLLMTMLAMFFMAVRVMGNDVFVALKLALVIIFVCLYVHVLMLGQMR